MVRVVYPRLPCHERCVCLEGFPTKAVVSPEGKLLKVVVGEDPEFYTYLDELLGEN